MWRDNKVGLKTQGWLIFIFLLTTISALLDSFASLPSPISTELIPAYYIFFASDCFVSYFKRIRCTNKLCGAERREGSRASILIVHLWSLCMRLHYFYIFLVACFVCCMAPHFLFI